ncbi:UPF0187-domain-containing protein [Dendrothele bispora CBS 962.96]|uniref:UPF0187-domain-containing protein n=1 Tax=Dendrothele bispora (strain CBS 962.96) TaxID=1314807 RepID=A0A4S8M9F5_DENBC|nr:UPF0187-domain-containing protein [Dendrothele bispora CBS 962.96]
MQQPTPHSNQYSTLKVTFFSLSFLYQSDFWDLRLLLVLEADLERVATISHKGFRTPDPFAPRRRPGSSFVNALLATALFRCWHLLIFFGAWATLITVLNEQGHDLTFDATLLTVIGTVLGFVISYRTTSSFERYNEGRRLWSQIIFATRTFARTVWFHIPESAAAAAAEVSKARATIEKKTVINLLEAFSVAVKHYLRGEDGIYYEDLYYLVKFLPAYALPTGIPSHADLTQPIDNKKHGPVSPQSIAFRPQMPGSNNTFLHQRTTGGSSQAPPELPAPATASSPPKKQNRFSRTLSQLAWGDKEKEKVPLSSTDEKKPDKLERIILRREDEKFLYPSWDPPRYYGLFNLFPFSLLVKVLTSSGKELKGKKAARLRAKMRAKMRNVGVSHNLPLEISLYLSSYISALQVRQINEAPTTSALVFALNQLVDSLTGLEHILTTPIPFSYSIHLWVVTVIYCFALPPQIYPMLRWITIPATIILTFIFFGFLVAGEEIQNPFGYDKNDLDLDHFTHNIIRNELQALTSAAPPNPARWAFVTENNLLFARDVHNDERVAPEEWVKRGYTSMQSTLSEFRQPLDAPNSQRV